LTPEQLYKEYKERLGDKQRSKTTTEMMEKYNLPKWKLHRILRKEMIKEVERRKVIVEIKKAVCEDCAKIISDKFLV
jgi:hypothetical protein